jgi:hypothetical protein
MNDETRQAVSETIEETEFETIKLLTKISHELHKLHKLLSDFY